MMTPEKAARVAAKRNARLRRALPLFADQLPRQTAEDVLGEFERHARRHEEGRARLRQRAEAFRAQVQACVSAEAFAALEARRRVLPSSDEYDADFWRRQLAGLAAGGEAP